MRLPTGHRQVTACFPRGLGEDRVTPNNFIGNNRPGHQLQSQQPSLLLATDWLAACSPASCHVFSPWQFVLLPSLAAAATFTHDPHTHSSLGGTLRCSAWDRVPSAPLTSAQWEGAHPPSAGWSRTCSLAGRDGRCTGPREEGGQEGPCFCNAVMKEFP